MAGTNEIPWTGSVEFGSPEVYLVLVALPVLALCWAAHVLYKWHVLRKAAGRDRLSPVGTRTTRRAKGARTTSRPSSSRNVALLAQAESPQHCVFFQVATERDYFGTVLFWLGFALLIFLLVVPLFVGIASGLFVGDGFDDTVLEWLLPDQEQDPQNLTTGWKFYFWFVNKFLRINLCTGEVLALNGTGENGENPMAWAMTNGFCDKVNMGEAVWSFFFMSFFAQIFALAASFFLASELFVTVKNALCFRRSGSSLFASGDEQDPEGATSGFKSCGYVGVYRYNTTKRAVRLQKKNDGNDTYADVVPELDAVLVSNEKVHCSEHAIDVAEEQVQSAGCPSALAGATLGGASLAAACLVPNLRELIEVATSSGSKTKTLGLRSFTALSATHHYSAQKGVFQEPAAETFDRLQQERCLTVKTLQQISADRTQLVREHFFSKNKMAISFPSFGSLFGRKFASRSVMVTLSMLPLFFISGQTNYIPIMLLFLVVQFLFAAFAEWRHAQEVRDLVLGNRERVTFDRAFDFSSVRAVDLIPGDVICLDNAHHRGQTLPADFVLLNGAVACNEASLTGENVPVQKFAVGGGHGSEDDQEDTDLSQIRTPCLRKRHVLYEGSVLLEVSGPATSDEGGGSSGSMAPVLAMVTGTGTDTKKGGLLQIMFQQPKYVSSLEKSASVAMLLQLLLAIVLVVVFLQKFEFGADMTKFNTLSVILIQVAFLRLSSPLAAAGVLQAARVASQRLRAGKFQVRSMDALRLLDASQTRVMCFDKTGTLTEEAQRFDRLETASGILANRMLKKRSCRGSMKMNLDGAGDAGGGGSGSDSDAGGPAVTARAVSPTMSAKLDLASSCAAVEDLMLCGRGSQRQSSQPEIGEAQLLTLALMACNTAAKVRGEVVGNAVETEMLRVARDELGVDFKTTASEFVCGCWQNNCLDYFAMQSDGEEHSSDDSALLGTPERSVSMGLSSGQEVPFATVLKQFEFDQHLQLQSVLVRLKNGKHYVLTKGSPRRVLAQVEGLGRERTKTSSGAPSTSTTSAADHAACFQEHAEQLAQRGHYLLAVAMKEVDLGDGSNFVLTRENLECDLHLLGLIVFRNELKPDSAEVIQQFRDAAVLPQMITGDNIFSGSAIARKVGIVPAEEAAGNDFCLLALDATKSAKKGGRADTTADKVDEEQQQTPEEDTLAVSYLSSTSRAIRESGIPAEDVLVQFAAAVQKAEESDPLGCAWERLTTSSRKVTLTNAEGAVLAEHVNCRFVVTQDAFHLLRRCELEQHEAASSSTPLRSAAAAAGSGTVRRSTTTKWCYRGWNEKLLRKIFPRTAVFGSMTPNGKTDVVQYWRHEFGYRVGMCGDGGNDSAALRVADLGVSLSNAEETSYRAETSGKGEHDDQNSKSEITFLAPFAADTSSIRSCVHVLKEARAVAENATAVYAWVLIYGLAMTFLRQYLMKNNAWFSMMFAVVVDLLAVPLAVLVLTRGRAPEAADRSDAANKGGKQQKLRKSSRGRSGRSTLGSRTMSRTGSRAGKLHGDNHVNTEDPEADTLAAQQQQRSQQKSQNQRELFPHAPVLTTLAPVRVWLLGVVLPLALVYSVPFMWLFVSYIAPAFPYAELTWFRRPVDYYGTYLLVKMKHNEGGQSVLAGLSFSAFWCLLGVSLLYLGMGSKFRSGKLWKRLSFWFVAGGFFLPWATVPVFTANNWLTCNLVVNCDHRSMSTKTLTGGAKKNGWDSFVQLIGLRPYKWFDFELTGAPVWFYEPGTDLVESSELGETSKNHQRMRNLTETYDAIPSFTDAKSVARDVDVTGEDRDDVLAARYSFTLTSPSGEAPKIHAIDDVDFWKKPLQAVLSVGEEKTNQSDELAGYFSGRNADRQQTLLRALYLVNPRTLAQALRSVVIDDGRHRQLPADGTAGLSAKLEKVLTQKQADFAEMKRKLTAAGAEKSAQIPHVDAFLDALLKQFGAYYSDEMLLAPEAQTQQEDDASKVVPTTVQLWNLDEARLAAAGNEGKLALHNLSASSGTSEAKGRPPSLYPVLQALEKYVYNKELQQGSCRLELLELDTDQEKTRYQYGVKATCQTTASAVALGGGAGAGAALALDADGNTHPQAQEPPAQLEMQAQAKEQAQDWTGSWAFACQELCQATWRLGASMDAHSPFHCHWAAISDRDLSRQNGDQSDQSSECYLLPRVDRARVVVEMEQDGSNKVKAVNSVAPTIPDDKVEAKRNALGPDFELYLSQSGKDEGQNSVLLKFDPAARRPGAGGAGQIGAQERKLRPFYANRHVVLGWESLAVASDRFEDIFLPGKWSAGVVFGGWFALLFAVSGLLIAIKGLVNLVEKGQSQYCRWREL